MRFNDLLSNTDERTFWQRYGHLGDEYMTGRRKAENVALDLAIQCQDEAHEKLVSSVPLKFSKGQKFVAVGGYDVTHGVQFFAVDYVTPEDRADVDEWIKALA